MIENIHLKPVLKTFVAQDGAIWGDFFFRFTHRGECRVFDIKGIENVTEELLPTREIARFSVSPDDAVIPHFNSVCFGAEYAEEGDEFPLLYANIYNNYSKNENQREGMTCVYRLTRENFDFHMEMVQIIRIGFTEDTSLWKSAGEIPDKRPYGNFLVDPQTNRFYGFTMRDATQTTRYFAFPLPRLTEGEWDKEYKVKVKILEKEDILFFFDTPYHHFLQGAALHNGLIYSTEGFDEKIHPGFRVIDPEKRQQIFYADLFEMGYREEPEWIDFKGDTCYYSDAKGTVFQVTFE